MHRPSPFGLYGKLLNFGWLINNRNLFLTVLESEDQWAGWLSSWWRHTLSVIDRNFLLCPHMMEGMRSLSLALFVKALISFMRAPFLWSNYFPKVPPPNTVILGVKMPTHELQRDSNIQSIFEIVITDFYQTFFSIKNTTWKLL